ncbi:MAG: COQ9 family protein [Novosphingobium sp.]|nr:COQ9 family protein [Novosphingobium sp.]
MSETDDLTLDEMRLALAPAIAEAAVFDGWSRAALREAAQRLGADPEVAAYAFRGGPMEMIAAWIAHVDSRMEAAFADDVLEDLPVRERIRRLIAFRLECVAGLEEALRRALAIMAMPHNAARALRLSWASADRMWRLAGDRATDFNHYTKRATLAAIYAATLAIFVDDSSEGKAETFAFLDRRIDGIVRLEKLKASLSRRSPDRFSLARFLGRLRYPAS